MPSIMARVLAIYAKSFYRPPYATHTRYGQMRAMLDEIMNGGDKRPIVLSRKETRQVIFTNMDWVPCNWEQAWGRVEGRRKHDA